METPREIETKRLINQVNLLIDEVDYLLETSSDLTCLNARLGMLAQWGVEIYTYFQDNPDMDLLSKIKSSAPLYILMLKAQMPSETRDSISQYCKWIALSKECGNSNNNLTDTPFRTLLQQLDEGEKERFIGVLADFLKSRPKGRIVAMIMQALVSKAYLPDCSATKLHTALVAEFGDDIITLPNFRKYYEKRSDVKLPTQIQKEAVKSIVEKLTGQTYLITL